VFVLLFAARRDRRSFCFHATAVHVPSGTLCGRRGGSREFFSKRIVVLAIECDNLASMAFGYFPVLEFGSDSITVCAWDAAIRGTQHPPFERIGWTAWKLRRPPGRLDFTVSFSPFIVAAMNALCRTRAGGRLAFDPTHSRTLVNVCNGTIAGWVNRCSTIRFESSGLRAASGFGRLPNSATGMELR